MFRDDLAMIDGVAMKGKRIIISAELQLQALGQLHCKNVAKGKTRLLAKESAYWIHTNADIENAIKLLIMSWF